MKLVEASAFRKSSFSHKFTVTWCVQVAIQPDGVAVAHSKDLNRQLHYTKEEWNAFIQGVKAGEFNI